MTPEAQALVELAERVEIVSGLDRGMDAKVCLAVGLAGNNIIATDQGWVIGGYTPGPTRALEYTGSVDAALTLVPPGWFTRLALEDRHSHSWHWELRGGYGWQVASRAPSAARAVLAAALRALASLDKLGGVKGEGVSDG